MDVHERSSRRRTMELPKPETGLAEWTSKIKAMQRQVDADEEAEQKRLEEEIAASRRARLRRSHGVGSGYTDSLDMSKNSVLSSTLSGLDKDVVGNDALKLPADREKNPSDAMHKPMGDGPSPRSTTPRTTSNTSVATSSMSPSAQTRIPPTPAKVSEPMSLAAFMGGRATGPMLRKHAPQQDAHDPTQFEQRTHISTPHPIFGKGGVAMPGMAAKEGLTTSPPPVGYLRNSTERSRSATDLMPNKGSNDMKPPPTKPSVLKVESLAVPQKGGNGYEGREHTINSPGRISPVKSPSPQLPGYKVSTGAPGRQVPQTKPQPSTSSIRTPPSSPPAAQHFIPRHQLPSPVVVTPPKQSPITTPSLARPIQPNPKPSPRISSHKMSTAFLQPPAEKAPTPSLSRLKGRGFVQNMVKVSSQLEASTPGSPTSSEKSPPMSGRKKVSVLDRWQPEPSHATSPPITPTKSLREARTISPIGPSNPTEVEPPPPLRFSKSADATTSPKPTAALSSIRVDAKPYVRKSSWDDAVDDTPPPGLGSSSTLISYIKPTKTGDEPLVTHPAPTPIVPPSRSAANELGVRTRRSEQIIVPKMAAAAALPSPTGKHLRHPTKDRAKKPRKADAKQGSGEEPGPEYSPPCGVQHPSNPNVPEECVSPYAPSSAGTSLNKSSPSPEFLVEDASHSFSCSSNRPTTVSDTRTLEGQSTSRVNTVVSGNLSPVDDRSIQSQRASDGLFGGRALPGLTERPSFAQEPASTSQESGSIIPTGRRALPDLTTPVPLPEKEDMSPISPVRHGRIPSTGNRATVMDVAQALNDPENVRASVTVPNNPQPAMITQAQYTPPFENDVADREVAIPRTRHTTPPGIQSERRRSNYERYSAIMLPPLMEENTPVSSPGVTLSRNANDTNLDRPVGVPPEVLDSLNITGQTTSTLESSTKEDIDVVRFHHVDEPVPNIDIRQLMATKLNVFTPVSDTIKVSVEVITITGTTTSSISRDLHIFYDSDVLAVVYRSKSKATGLVSTQVWGWLGQRSVVGEREERKLEELAKRYGTALETVHQYSEPALLLYALGGTLAIRQGPRAHWSPANTAMHLVRSSGGFIFIDEHDLSVRNLCSGFSYCLTILDNVYVWYGSGSLSEERSVAVDYARGIAAKGTSVVELVEGESDLNDEIFWMMLGDDEYARADYWRWRPSTGGSDPRIWRVDAEHPSEMVAAVLSFSRESNVSGSVYVFDCVWEFFVLVGSEARSRRADIRLAISAATKLSAQVAPSRPFPPTVHVLVLPTQLPLDLRLHFRDVQEESLNIGDVPDHMNILSYMDAIEHLQKQTWGKTALRDPDMLPLSLHPSNVP